MINAKGYAAHSKTEALQPWDFERREVGTNDVLIDILYCGICHSDIHQVRSEWGPAIYPLVPGHEIVGRITAVGTNVSQFKVGELAGIGCMVNSCQHCDSCNHGQEQFCDNKQTVWTYNSRDKDGSVTYGGYSNKIVCDQHFVLHVSDKLDLKGVAPLLCAGITTYSPLRKWKVGKGHKVGVLGLGGLGHMAVKFAVSFGAEVTMLSTSPSKEADAKRLGAHKFVLTKDPEQVKSLDRYFDFIIDTVSAPHDYNMYLQMLKTNGVQICVGLPPEPLSIAGGSLMRGNRVLTASSIGGIPETQEMLDYCAEHNIVSDIELIDIKDVNTAYERVLKSDVKYRFVIDLATL
ncbi:NAD(P)-dependent alcohol dehydrogenase [Niabella sp. CC-SYL272]|uniref:NAD(P)-dependent alcohol dehydrogenase n=1 Tax=Niabella agricola TaxID=2891571 RepID=UPI001F1AFCAB|nr:NAD(P)-dependent alcohol dehydrogenase [Niabella agricola]MCF3107991.1 NAD(P)-dependent alcohol dehydrogenase [Niabella agricola]